MDEAIQGTVEELKGRLSSDSMIQVGKNYYQVGEISNVGISAFEMLDGGGFAHIPTPISLDTQITYLPRFRITARNQ